MFWDPNDIERLCDGPPPRMPEIIPPEKMGWFECVRLIALTLASYAIVGRLIGEPIYWILKR